MGENCFENVCIRYQCGGHLLGKVDLFSLNR